MDEHRKQALRAALGYAVLAGLSMPLADALLHGLVADTAIRTTSIAYKDWAFVLATTLLVFHFTRRTLMVYARLLGEVQRSDLRFRTIFDGVGDGIFLCDPKTAAFIDVNATMEEMYGYSRDELCRLSFADLSADPAHEAQRRVAAVLARVNRGETPILEWHAKRRDGTLFWVEVDLQQGIIEGRPHIMALVREVTRRKEVEEALRESEERFRLIADSIPHLVWAADANGRLTFASSRLADYIGGRPVGSGQSFHFLHPDDYQHTVAAWQHAATTGTIFEIEHRIRRADGAYHWFLSRSYPPHNAADDATPRYGSSTDIHDLRKAQGEMSLSEARYRELFYANPHPMWAYDLETLAFLAVNDAAVAHYGYTRDEFLAMTIKDIRPAEDVPALLVNVAAVTDGLDDAGVWRHRLRNGTLIDVSVRSHVLDFNGRRAELVAAFDVTEQRRIDAEIRHLNVELEQRVAERTAQLEAANKELDSFAYSVCHDLKAPLRRIDGYAQILDEDHADELSSGTRDALKSIHDGIVQMHGLIEDLLAYSRMERQPLERDVLAMTDLVHELTAELDQELRDNGAVLEVEIPSIHVHADAEGLAMVLRNLVENALKFSRNAQPPTVQIGARADEGKAVLWVRDNGIGFDMRHHDRIFEMFQRLEKSERYPGTGVGLALVRKAVQRMDGRVWATSEPGSGATFYVELPA